MSPHLFHFLSSASLPHTFQVEEGPCRGLTGCGKKMSTKEVHKSVWLLLQQYHDDILLSFFFSTSLRLHTLDQINDVVGFFIFCFLTGVLYKVSTFIANPTRQWNESL